MNLNSLLQMKYYPLCILFVCLSFTVQAQFEKIIHQTFEVDQFDQIDLDVYGEYKVETWAGNVVLTESKIQLFDASPSIFDYYLGKKRYDLVAEETASGLLIKSFDRERKQIRTKKGECYEIIEITLFVPEDFEKKSENKLIREQEMEPAVTTDDQ